MLWSRSIDHFKQVAVFTTFREAARALRISEPALSISIRKLEEELNTQLFTRSRTGIELTPEGRNLLRLLRTTGARIEKDLSKITSPTTLPPLRFGCVSHIATRRLLPHIAKIPTDEVQFLFGKSRTIYEALQDGSLDFGIIGWTKRPRWGRAELIRRDRQGIVGLKTKYAAIRNARSVDELQGYNWVWLNMPQHHWTYYEKLAKHSLVVDDVGSYQETLMSGWGIGMAQFDIFTPAMEKKLVVSKANFPVGADLYLVGRAGLERPAWVNQIVDWVK